jgi:hypothetical protein
VAGGCCPCCCRSWRRGVLAVADVAGFPPIAAPGVMFLLSLASLSCWRPGMLAVACVFDITGVLMSMGPGCCWYHLLLFLVSSMLLASLLVVGIPVVPGIPTPANVTSVLLLASPKLLSSLLHVEGNFLCCLQYF